LEIQEASKSGHRFREPFSWVSFFMGKLFHG
jgi:hypothetical protein